jgi:hypothetical protein
MCGALIVNGVEAGVLRENKSDFFKLAQTKLNQSGGIVTFFCTAGFEISVMARAPQWVLHPPPLLESAES